MKQLFFIGLLWLALIGQSCQEQDKSYFEIIKEAETEYDNGAFLKAAAAYSRAFKVKGVLVDDMHRFNAASSWAKANEKDASFKQLFYIIDKGNFDYYEFIIKVDDFDSLKSDARWAELKAHYDIQVTNASANLDENLVAVLDSIHQEDQQYRLQLRGIEEKYGRGSAEMAAQWAIINSKDSTNLIIVEEILDSRGWLGREIIGLTGNSTLFLVIQHADIETQVKYLPMMRLAAKEGKANPGSLALLEDRVALRQGERQIYGSQIGRYPESGEFYILPLDDPENVDERRARVGLQSLQDYVAGFKIVWDAEAYIKRLPEIEALQQ